MQSRQFANCSRQANLVHFAAGWTTRSSTTSCGTRCTSGRIQLPSQCQTTASSAKRAFTSWTSISASLYCPYSHRLRVLLVPSVSRSQPIGAAAAVSHCCLQSSCHSPGNQGVRHTAAVPPVCVQCHTCSALTGLIFTAGTASWTQTSWRRCSTCCTRASTSMRACRCRSLVSQAIPSSPNCFP